MATDLCAPISSLTGFHDAGTGYVVPSLVSRCLDVPRSKGDALTRLANAGKANRSLGQEKGNKTMRPDTNRRSVWCFARSGRVCGCDWSRRCAVLPRCHCLSSFWWLLELPGLELSRLKVGVCVPLAPSSPWRIYTVPETVHIWRRHGWKVRGPL